MLINKNVSEKQPTPKQNKNTKQNKPNPQLHNPFTTIPASLTTLYLHLVPLEDEKPKD